MNRYIKGVSVFLILALIFGNITTVSASNNIQVECENIEILSELRTEEQIVLYTGEVKDTTHLDNPSSDCMYVIVTLKVSNVGLEHVELSDFSIRQVDTTYTYEENNVLQKHNRSQITNISEGITRGQLLFEVPKGGLEQISVQYQEKEIIINANAEKGWDLIGETNIPYVNNEINDNTQKILENDILETFNRGSYIFESPLIIKNPYDKAPLTALALYQSNDMGKVEVSIKGQQGSSDYIYEVDVSKGMAQVPILGLFPQMINTVEIGFIDSNGVVNEKTVIKIETEALPEDIYNLDVDINNLEEEKDTFIHIGGVNGYNTIIDRTGTVRWYYDDNLSFGFTYLDNGHLYVCKQKDLEGDLTASVNQQSTLMEIDMLGKIHTTIELDNRMHHELIYNEKDNLLYASTHNIYGNGVEDTVLAIDIVNGTVEESIDFSEVLDRYRIGTADQLTRGEDWLHINSVSFDEDNSMLISARRLGMVKLDNEKELQWILAQHDNWTEEFQDYLLTPIDEKGNELYDLSSEEGREDANRNFFPLQQHAIEVLGDLDDNSDTLEVIIFNNGGYYSYVDQFQEVEESETIIYSIDAQKMTVQILRRFGRELGEDFYSNSVSDANLLDNDHILITAGDLTNNDAVNAHIIQVDSEDNIVWSATESTIDERMYDVETVDLYPENYIHNIAYDAKEYDIKTKVGSEGFYNKFSHYHVEENKGTTIDITIKGDHIILEGRISGFEFNRQYGFLKLYDNTGAYQIEGFVLQDDMSVSQKINIDPSSIYKYYEILIVDEMKERIYTSDKLQLGGVSDINNVTEIESIIKPKNMPETQFCMDSISIDNTHLNLEGWAFLIDEKSKNTNIQVVAEGDDYTFEIANKTISRPDINLAFDSKDYEEAGFKSIDIPLDKFKNGEYRLGIRLENGKKSAYIDTEYYFTINDRLIVETEDLLKQQEIQTQEILNAYGSQENRLENPLVVVDPYEISPLSALIMFETDEPAKVNILVEGIDGGTTFSHEFDEYRNSHQIPVIGLYSQVETKVTLGVRYEDGGEDTKVLAIAGKKLPVDSNSIELIQSDVSQMAEGLTFYAPSGGSLYFQGIDHKGDVRYLISRPQIGLATSIEVLDNGNFLITGDTSTGHLYYTNSFYEMEPTGRIVKEYLLEGLHHEVIVLPNGNYLALGNDPNGLAIEDTIYEIDRETGEYVKIWDMDAYFQVESYDQYGRRISVETQGSDAHDWIHINSLSYDKTNDAIIISGRAQNVIISMDYYTGEINYIISNPELPLPLYLQDKLIKSVDDSFEWQFGQHNIQILDNGDLLFFDNGNSRANNLEDAISPEDNYSRAVRVSIDIEEGTINNVWEYGHELGSEYYCEFLSGVQFLGEDHYLINFGGQIKDSEGNAESSFDDLFAGTGATKSNQIEVKNGTVVYETQLEANDLSGNVYRSKRIENLYENSKQSNIHHETYRVGELLRYGTVSEISVPQLDSRLSYNSLEIKDKGMQLSVSVSLPENTSNEAVHLYFSGEKDYMVYLGAGTNVSKVINSSEIPKDHYGMYLVSGQSSVLLNYVWEKQIELGEGNIGYNIEVTKKIGSGSVHGTGIYYENTPFTIFALPDEGSVFHAWKVNGRVVSREENLTLVATDAAEYIAIFGPEGTYYISILELVYDYRTYVILFSIYLIMLRKRKKKTSNGSRKNNMKN